MEPDSFFDIFPLELDGAVILRSLQTLKFGQRFDQTLKDAVLMTELQTSNFNLEFRQRLEGCITQSMQTLSRGMHVHQSRWVLLTRDLQTSSFLKTLNFDRGCDRGLGQVTRLRYLLALRFVLYINQSLEGVALASGLQALDLTNQSERCQIPLQTEGFTIAWESSRRQAS